MNSIPYIINKLEKQSSSSLSVIEIISSNKKQENQLLEVIGQMKQIGCLVQNDKKENLFDQQFINRSKEKNNGNMMDLSVEKYNQLIQKQIELTEKEMLVNKLQMTLNREKQNNILERKANQVYSNLYAQLKQIVNKSMDKNITTMEQLLQEIRNIFLQTNNRQHIILKNSIKQQSQQYEIIAQQKQANWNQYFHQQQNKINQLRAQLVKSSRNNITAIFSTNITANMCIQEQIKDINDKFNYLKKQIQQRNNAIHHNNNCSKAIKIYNVYGQSYEEEEEDSDSNIIQQLSKLNRSKGRKKFRKIKLKRQRIRASLSSNSSLKKSMKSKENDKSKQMEYNYKHLEQNYTKIYETMKSMEQVQIKLLQRMEQRNDSADKQESNHANNSGNNHYSRQKSNTKRRMIHWQQIQNNIELITSQQKNQEDHIPYSNITVSAEVLHQNHELIKQNKSYIKQIEQLEKKVIMLEKQIQRFNGDGNQKFEERYQTQRKQRQRKEKYSSQCINYESKIAQKIAIKMDYQQQKDLIKCNEKQNRKLKRYENMIMQKEIRISQLEDTIYDYIEGKFKQTDNEYILEMMKDNYEKNLNNTKLIIKQYQSENQSLKELINQYKNNKLTNDQLASIKQTCQTNQSNPTRFQQPLLNIPILKI